MLSYVMLRGPRLRLFECDQCISCLSFYQLLAYHERICFEMLRPCIVISCSPRHGGLRSPLLSGALARRSSVIWLVIEGSGGAKWVVVVVFLTVN
jgi:hypothetical protein